MKIQIEHRRNVNFGDFGLHTHTLAPVSNLQNGSNQLPLNENPRKSETLLSENDRPVQLFPHIRNVRKFVISEKPPTDKTR